jgi:ubiquinone biosynthesis protein UbiJ
MSRVPLPLAQLALSGMNHVLQQQPAARERMKIHVSRIIRIVIAGPFGQMHSDARIDRDGLLSLTTDGAPAAVLTFSPGINAFFGVLSAGPRGLGPHLKVEGDVMLAAAVGEVAQSLRWDYEEDLSKVIGDGLAHRAGQALRGLREQSEGLRQRSREALQRAAVAQQGPLVSVEELTAFKAELEIVSMTVSRLELISAARPSS